MAQESLCAKKKKLVVLLRKKEKKKQTKPTPLAKPHAINFDFRTINFDFKPEQCIVCHKIKRGSGSDSTDAHTWGTKKRC